MKKVIITGAAGLVGINLLRELKNKDHEILAIDKNQKRLKLAKKINPNIKTLCCDLAKKDNWSKYFNNTDCVIQLQAQISDPNLFPYIKNNIDSVRNILEVCKKKKIKNLIHISSSVVISLAKDNYTNTKKAGEQLVLKSKVPYTVLRPPLMHGPFNTKHLSFIVDKFEKYPIVLIPGNGKYIRQPLYVLDFVKIIIKLIEKKPENKIYNIIGKEKIYFIDLIKLILKAKNKNKIFIQIPKSLFILLLQIYGTFTRSKPFIPDQLKALTAGDVFPVTNWEKEFGVKYTSFKECVLETIKIENGY